MIDAISKIDRRGAAVKLVFVTILVFVAGSFAVGYFAYRGVQSTVENFRLRDFTSAAWWRDEILIAQRVRQVDLTAIGRPEGPQQIMAINLQTGSIRELGIETSEPILKIVAGNDRLWVVCQNEIVETNGTDVTRWHPESFVPFARKEPPEFSRGEDIHPFLMNHGLAAIAHDRSGRNRLYTFESGEWQAGRQFASPGSGRSWANDNKNNQLGLAPITTATENLNSSRDFSESLTALQSGDEIHLVSINQYYQTDESGKSESVRIIAYRNGFDFVADEDHIASGLTPENDFPDTTGWRLLDPDRFNEWQIPINLAIGVAPELFALTRSPSILDDHTIHSVQHPSSKEIHLIAERLVQTCRVLKYVDDHFVPFPFVIPGLCEPWLVHDARVILLALIVVAGSHVVLLAGANRLALKWKLDHYSFGQQVVVLAPLGRRWLARGIDLFAQWMPMIALFFWGVAMCSPWELFRFSPTPRAYGLLIELNRMVFPTLPTFSLPSPIRDHGLVCFRMTCAWVVLFAMTMAITQGRSGLTLGKWICGIRVVRTTLRPCGLARSLLRELLTCVDTLNLLSPIPAVVAILMSSKRQRIGDLWSDTIVIVNG